MSRATTIKINLPAPHASQRRVMRNKRRFTVLCCGRRWGKTQLAQIMTVGALLEGKAVAYAAPIYKQTRKTWQAVRQIVAPIASTISEADKSLLLVTGGEFSAYSLDAPDSIRGVGVDLLIVDEAAFVPNMLQTWGRVLRPMLSDRQGSALFISTPNGALNDFFTLYQTGLSQPDWASFRFPTSANPFIQPAEIDAARAQLDPLTFEQEYLAEFVVSSGSVFGSIRHALTDEPAHPDPRKTYIGGVDWGQADDYTALSIMCAEDNREVYLGRWRQMSWIDMRAHIVEACRTWCVGKLVVERNSASSNVESLAQELHAAGLSITLEPRTMSAPLKAKLVATLYDGLHRDGLRLLNDEHATREMMSYVSKQTATGLWSYTHPDGGHDDTVDARLWAYYGLTRMV